VQPLNLPDDEQLPRPANSARHLFFVALRLLAGIAILVYLAKSGIISLAALSKLILAWPITIAAIAVFFIDIFLMAVRTSLLFRPFGMRLTILKSVELTLVSLFFSTFLPGAGGGDLVKLYYATKENAGRRAEVATILMFDRSIGFFAMLILPLFFVPMFLPLLQSVPVLRTILIFVAALSAAMLAAFLLFAFSVRLRDFLARRSMPFPRWRNLAARVLEIVRSLARNPGTLLAALLLSVFANLSVIVITVFAVLILDPHSLSSRMCLVIPIGHVVNALPLTPGGLGVGETALNALFELTGLHGGAETLLFWRVWKAIVGLLGLFIYIRGMGSIALGSKQTEPRRMAT